MRRKKTAVKDESYYVGKKLITTSTISTSDFLAAVHELYPEYTIDELKIILSDRTRFLRDDDAMAVIDAHIEAGYGDMIPNWR